MVGMVQNCPLVNTVRILRRRGVPILREGGHRKVLQAILMRASFCLDVVLLSDKPMLQKAVCL